MSWATDADNCAVMWLFDTAATSKTQTSFVYTSNASWTQELTFDNIMFPWEWHFGSQKETVVPTKGHLSPPRLRHLSGHQKMILKNEFSGRRY